MQICIAHEPGKQFYYYAARTAQVYRQAIDAAEAGKDFKMGQLYNSKNNTPIDAALESRYQVDLVIPKLSQAELEKGLLVRDLTD